MATNEIIIYKGIKFYRYPESDQHAHRSYYTPGIGDKQRGVDYLHREIWKDHNNVDEIPDGYHVHHSDHNPLNNDPENLVLVDAVEHLTYHMGKRFDNLLAFAESAQHLEQIRPLAAKWHGSEAGRKWHSEHGVRVWKAREAHELKCEHCDSVYETKSKHGNERFCSNKCKSAWRRDAGIDDVQRQCAYCGESFTVNKYSKKRCCGRNCASSLRWSERAARLQSNG